MCDPTLRPRGCTCEPLERRIFLAASTISVTVFNDLNRDGRRNSNEPGLPNWGVIAFDVRDAQGINQRVAGRTDVSGAIALIDNVFDFELPGARVYIEPEKRLYCTTHQRAASGWFGIAGTSIAFGLTDVAPITGQLLNWYTRDDGQPATTPLAARRVYEDANRNGRFDPTEKSANTDLDGNFTLSLRTGTHTLRADPGRDWTAAPGTKLVRSAVVYPYQNFPAIRAMMAAPIVVDVLAAYTHAAGDVLDGQPDMLNELFRQTNRIFANSGTNVLINLAGTFESTYVESGEIDEDLTHLQKPSDGVLDLVVAERNRIRADLAVLLTSRDATDGDVIGLAYEFQRSAGSDAFGFSVVTIDEFENGETLAHELGHNFGAGHDAATIADEDDEPVEAYAQGYRFRAGSDNRTFKDVMAYGGGTMLPFFSTPKFKHLGKSIGTPDAADNARIIREIAPLVAEYR